MCTICTFQFYLFSILKIKEDYFTDTKLLAFYIISI